MADLWDTFGDFGTLIWKANFATSVSAFGDPHLVGFYGQELDIFGEPGANYSLVVGPAFVVNVQLAARGPKERFMTHMAVLYRGQTITFDALSLKSRKAALISHFEALGSKIVVDGWTMTIDLCPNHQLVFTAHSNERLMVNFLNFQMLVPDCDSVYDGLLGHTCQCRWATDAYRWSREHEITFAVPTLTTANDVYSPTAPCSSASTQSAAGFAVVRAATFSSEMRTWPMHVA